MSAAPDLRVAQDLDEVLERTPDVLRPALQAAVALAQEGQGLIDFVPGDTNPVVLARQRLAPLQAAVDAFLDAAGELVETHVPA